MRQVISEMFSAKPCTLLGNRVRLASSASLAAFVLLAASLGHGQGLRLDHLTVAVRDLPQAVLQAERVGFTVKPGRLHDNGLKNAFIEFADGTEIELMTLVGLAQDDVSRTYEKFLARGEGAIFLALSAENLSSVQHAWSNAGISTRLSEGSAWSYLTVESPVAFRGLYFIRYSTEPPHQPGRTRSGIRSIALSLNPQQVEQLGRAFADIGYAPAEDGRIELQRGAVVLTSGPRREFLNLDLCTGEGWQGPEETEFFGLKIRLQTC